MAHRSLERVCNGTYIGICSINKHRNETGFKWNLCDRKWGQNNGNSNLLHKIDRTEVRAEITTTTTTATMSNEINDKCRWINKNTESWKIEISVFQTSWKRFNFIYGESHSKDNEQTMRQDTIIKCVHSHTYTRTHTYIYSSRPRWSKARQLDHVTVNTFMWPKWNEIMLEVEREEMRHESKRGERKSIQ